MKEYYEEIKRKYEEICGKYEGISRYMGQAGEGGSWQFPGLGAQKKQTTCKGVPFAAKLISSKKSTFRPFIFSAGSVT
mgnify:CR=1 FL=1